MIPITNVLYWFGVVEDINDPEMLDRVRVRVYGAHSANKSIQDIDGTPTEHLMWMNTIMPVTSAQFSGVGQRHGLLPGSTVFGMYLDPECQTGIVMGSMQTKNSSRDPNKGFSDPSGQYPYNQYNNRQSIPERATGSQDPSEQERQNTGSGSGSYVPDFQVPGKEDDTELFKLSDIIRLEEGFRTKPYRDSLGKWTIGVGRLISNDTVITIDGACSIVQKMIGRTFRPGDSLTNQEVLDLYNEDLKKHEAAIQKYPNLLLTYNKLNKPRKMMIIQMCFQMGNKGVAKFKNTLAKMNANDWRGAYEGLLSQKWAHQTPARAKRVAQVIYEGNLNPYIGYMKQHGISPQA